MYRAVLRAIPLFFLLAMPPAAQAATVESGHSALWFDPARSGEGWVLEVIGGGQAALGWFTYDEDGGQRWLFGLGQIVEDESGQRIDFADLYTSTGGRFGPDFDPDAIERERVGEASMRFADCERGSFSYSAFGQSQTLSVRRIAYTMAAGCRSINGVPGEPIQAYAAQSGSWYDPARSGEGFQLQWTSRNEALLGWYTFDGEGNQFWMTGQGYREAERIVFPALYSTRGGRFGEAFDAAEVERTEWGSLVLELNCDAGTARYESSLPGFGSGELPLLRLTGAVPVACPWTAPKLSDLYDVRITIIPIDPGAPGEPRRVMPRSIADDGTVVGLGIRIPDSPRYVLHRWRPGDTEWEPLSEHVLSSSQARIAPDGSFIVASYSSLVDLQEQDGPVVYRDGTGWASLPGRTFDRSFMDGASQDATRVVGRGRPFGYVGEYLWIWDAENGQVELPLSEEVRAASPLAASNDGAIVVGRSVRPTGGGIPLTQAVRWVNGGPPSILRDTLGADLATAKVCSADGSIVFGSSQTGYEAQHPNRGQSWYWISPQRFGYLGTLEEAQQDAYGIEDANADGTMAVGIYRVFDNFGRPGTQGFIWTQATGLVAIPTLLAEVGIDMRWDVMEPISIASGGSMILLSGFDRATPGVPWEQNVYRAALLHLDLDAKPSVKDGIPVSHMGRSK